MKKILILFLALLSSTTFGQSESGVNGCGKGTPRFCVGEPVYKRSAFGYIVSFDNNGEYGFKYHGGNYSGVVESNVSTDELYRATKGKCGTTVPRFCNGDVVYIQHSKGIVVGVGANGTYAFQYVGGNYSGSVVPSNSPVDLYKGDEGKCGNTTPRFCVGEPVYRGGYYGKIVGFNAKGEYAFMYEGGNYSGSIEGSHAASSFTKIKNSGTSGQSCDGIEPNLSEMPADVMNSYLALAKVTTAERSDFLTEASKYLVAQNQGDSTLMARLMFAQIVKKSTAKVVQDNFLKPVQQDQQELEKLGWRNVDQIDAKASTLDFGVRVLAAAVKLRMSMPDANPSIQAFRSRLATIIAEPKLSVKITTLQAIVKDMQPMLQELMQDPRNGALGEVTQDVAGWVLKN
jgi:hypothetical protein